MPANARLLSLGPSSHPMPIPSSQRYDPSVRLDQGTSPAETGWADSSTKTASQRETGFPQPTVTLLGCRSRPAPQQVNLPLVLRRLALAEGEREVAATGGHVLDTGDLRHHPTAWTKDVEELGVGEHVLAVDDAEVAAKPRRARQPVDGARRSVCERHARRVERRYLRRPGVPDRARRKRHNQRGRHRGKRDENRNHFGPHLPLSFCRSCLHHATKESNRRPHARAPRNDETLAAVHQAPPQAPASCDNLPSWSSNN